MTTVNLYEAKSQLSKLVDRAAAGEEIIIAKSGRPLARLSALSVRREPRPLGLLRGEIRIAEDFEAPLPESLRKGFLGEGR